MEQANRQLPRHILVMRVSAMGDVAMLAHAIRAIKGTYPDLRVTIATRRLFEPFFRGLDVGFIFIETKTEHHGLRGLFRFARECRAMGIDAIADTHFVMRTILLSLSFLLHGIDVAHIRKGKVEKWFRLGYSNKDAVPLKHTVVRYCDVFRRFGFKFPNPEPVTVRPALTSPMGEKSGTWIGFAPFSAHEGKTYPEPLRSKLVELLAGRCDRLFIHGGGGQEKEFALEMERMYPNVTAVAPLLKLEAEIALISHLDCMVSMDSLAMHLCSLTATPVVSVWGATHPELGFLGYGCDPDGVLQVEMDCRPCSIYGNKPCKWGDMRCMHAISPETVAERVQYLINKNSL